MKMKQLALAASGLAVGSFAISSFAAETGGVRQLDEIVVTAQKRSENLQDVPVAVAAMDGDALDNRGVDNMQELGMLVPSLSVSNAVGFTITYLRGVGSNAIGPGLEPPVAIYLDGVYYASTTSSLFDFANVERVEVLKGPQGTLFGRNATGGLIQVLTRDPGDEFEARVNGTIGNYETFMGDLYLAGPISDTVSADIALVAGTQDEGYGENLATGEDIFANDHNITVRSKWVVTPSDVTKITIIGDYTDAENSFNGQAAPEGSLTNPILGPTPHLGGPWDHNASITPKYTNENWGLSLKLDHELDRVAITNLAAYRDSRTTLAFDVDFTPVEHFEADNLVDLETQFSNEFQVSSIDGEVFNWTAGLYYFLASGEYDPSGVCFCNDPTSPFGVATVIEIYGEQITKAYSGFAQGTYAVTDDTNLTLGVRYNYEIREVEGFTLADFGLTGDLVMLGGETDDRLDFESPTYRVAIDHRLTDNVMGYISWNRGFKSGGFNTQSTADPSFLPEDLDAWEVGIKSDLLDGILRVNAAAFHYDYKNIQVQKVGLANTGIINGAAATVKGVELDFEGVAGDNFSYGGSLSYTDGEFDEFTNAPIGPEPGTFSPNDPGDASGNDIPKTPEFQGTLHGNYRIGMADGSSLDLNLVYTYNSGYFLEADNVFEQEDYDLINASAKWTSADEHFSVKLWGKNLTDEAVVRYQSTLPDGSRNGSYEAPRTYGLTFGYAF